MPEHSLVIGLGFWVVFQAWRGYRKGFWRAFIALLGLALAYAVAIVCTPPLIAWMSDKDLPAFAPFAAYPILFFASYILVTSLPFIVFKGLDNKSAIQHWGGASIGAGSGLVGGLIFIWFIGFLISATAASKPQSPALAADGERSSAQAIKRQPIQELASSFVSKTTQVGLKVMGGDEAQVQSIDLLIRQPEVLMQGMQAVVKSQAMADIVRSPQTQRMMALNDVNSLIMTPAFTQLMAIPEMQSMTQKLQTQGRSSRESERFVAEQVTYLWRRMQYVKNDPRVVEILKDQHLQEQLKVSNPASLLANPKFQRLAAIVVGDSANMEDVDFTQYVQANNRAANSVLSNSGSDGMQQSSSSASSSVYKWQDDQGVMRYTDWQDIPDDKQQEASIVVP